jgi:anti-sigma B factor antagonist
MPLEFVEDSREGISVLRLRGRLVAGTDVAAFRERVERLLDGAGKRIVLDMRECGYIDSSGLGVLVFCFNGANAAGGGLRMFGLNSRNLELLVLTKLSTVFELYAEEQEAVNSFFPGRAIHRFDILDFLERNKREQGG